MAKKPGKTEQAHWGFAHGRDADFLEWLTYQPSCISGRFSEVHNGVGRSVACHVRTVAGGAGTAFKPPFSAVPLTDPEHKLTHQHGDSYFHPEDWWQEQVEKHLFAWIASMSL